MQVLGKDKFCGDKKKEFSSIELTNNINTGWGITTNWLVLASSHLAKKLRSYTRTNSMQFKAAVYLQHACGNYIVRNSYRISIAIYTWHADCRINHTYAATWTDLGETFGGASLIRNVCRWYKSVVNLHI